MSHLFAHYPREVDMKARKVVHDMKGLQRYINNTNGKDNLTTTVYGFRHLKVKGNRCRNPMYERYACTRTASQR